MTQAERQDKLEADWAAGLPCAFCEISEICRYKNAVKRVDYPADVFSIDIRCKVKDRYKKADSAESDSYSYAAKMSMGG